MVEGLVLVLEMSSYLGAKGRNDSCKTAPRSTDRVEVGVAWWWHGREAHCSDRNAYRRQPERENAYFGFFPEVLLSERKGCV